MYIFTNGTLIDGNGKEPVKNFAVTVEGSLIADVGPARERYPEGAIVVDLKGMTIMPGLVDVHNHFSGNTSVKRGETPMMNLISSNMYAQARKASIEHGVTTVRSAGDVYPDIVLLCEESSNLYGPRLFCVGPQFTSVGGHPAGTIYKPFPYLQKHNTRQVDDPKKAREEVRKVIEGGVHYIKAMLGTLNVWDLAHPVPRLPFPVFEAILDETHKHNMQVLVHCETPRDVEDALKCGADCIEHMIVPGFGKTDEVSDRLIQALVDSKVYYSPTLAITYVYSTLMPMPPNAYPTLSTLFKRVYDAGVKITVGTDAGAPPMHFGWTTHLEMEKMVEAGMKPMDTIMSATKTAAESMRKDKDFGTVEAGKLADIIVVDGNPAKNISDIRKIKLVMRDGKIMVDSLNVPRFVGANAVAAEA